MPTRVILLKDVDHVGLRGDVVSVARGYARNFLLPRKLAEVATPARVAGAGPVTVSSSAGDARIGGNINASGRDAPANAATPPNATARPMATASATPFLRPIARVRMSGLDHPVERIV